MTIRLRYFDYADKEYTYHDQLDMPCAWYAVENGKGEFELSTGLYDATVWEDLAEEERAEWTRRGNMPSEWKGKEIYEGDIISGGLLSEPCEVMYQEECGRFIAFGEHYKVFAHKFNQFKVIGNIHENHDLLERA